MAEPTSPAGENSPALYSFFCGLIAVPAAFLFGLGVIFGAAALILGRLGLQRANAGEGRRGWAIAGIVLGAIAILLVLGYLIDVATD
jgi:hypothetical protein